MSLVVIPNVSEGQNEAVVKALQASMAERGAKVLDRHSDGLHHRTVFTVAGSDEQLIRAAEALAVATAIAVDLTVHEGGHPRVGALDVCPFVPVEGDDLDDARAIARAAGERIGAAGIPVYFYGAAGQTPRELPDLRRGGLKGLIERADAGAPPDMGPRNIDPRTGVVCVGARKPLIAFNVWLEGPVTEAKRIAASVRASGGGLPGVRAIGLDMGAGRSQVSMNLTDPRKTSMEAAFQAVTNLADPSVAHVLATEIVGLPPERFVPGPETKVARLLMGPGHSLESRLQKL